LVKGLPVLAETAAKMGEVFELEGAKIA